MKKCLPANEICQVIEREITGIKCSVSHAGDQIAIRFEKRPDIVIHLLTPYYQQQIRKGGIPEDEIPRLIFDVRKIAEHKIKTDMIIEEITSFLSKQE